MNKKSITVTQKTSNRILQGETCDAWLGNREERKEEGMSDRGGDA